MESDNAAFNTAYIFGDPATRKAVGSSFASLSAEEDDSAIAEVSGLLSDRLTSAVAVLFRIDPTAALTQIWNMMRDQFDILFDTDMREEFRERLAHTPRAPIDYLMITPGRTRHSVLTCFALGWEGYRTHHTADIAALPPGSIQHAAHEIDPAGIADCALTYLPSELCDIIEDDKRRSTQVTQRLQVITTGLQNWNLMVGGSVAYGWNGARKSDPAMADEL